MATSEVERTMTRHWIKELPGAPFALVFFMAVSIFSALCGLCVQPLMSTNVPAAMINFKFWLGINSPGIKPD